MSLGENYFSTIIKRSVILILITSAIILMAFKEPKPYLYGFLFGSIINILNFRLMYLSTKRAMTLHSKDAQMHVTVNYLIRYITYGLVLVVAAKAEYINFYTVILGFFVIKTIILSDTLYETIKKR